MKTHTNKRLLSILLVLIICSFSAFSVLSVAEGANSGSCGNNLTWTLNSEGKLTISGTGNMNDFSSLASPWSENSDDIISVVIQNGVTNIGRSAFEDCSSLKTVTLPDSIISIDSCAFLNCSSLVSIGLQNGVKSIGSCAFYKCSALKSVNLPNSITSVGNNAFFGCSSIDNYNTYQNAKYLGNSENPYLVLISATGNNISSCEINSNAVAIAGGAFENCTVITSIEIPENIIDIGGYAFYNCRALSTVYLGKNIRQIGESAFGFEHDGEINKVHYANTENNRRLIDIKNGNTALTNAVWEYNYCKEHSVKDYWFGDSNNHWKECTVCQTKFENGKHIWDEGEITKLASCTETGTISYTCLGCLKIKNEIIPKIGHKYQTTLSYNGTYHYYKCADCSAVYKKALHTYKNNTVKATLTKNGAITPICTCGAKKTATAIYYPKTFTLSKTSLTYTGKAQKPTVKVVDTKGKVISTSYYTVTYKNNTNVGTATVTVTFKGNYSGTKNLTFKIVAPTVKTTTISKVTSAKKGFKVIWKKQSVTGYEIQYATNANFKSAKTVKVTSCNTTSKSISKLTAKKKYYLRIRTYKKVGSKTFYSAWSSKKSVITK